MHVGSPVLQTAGEEEIFTWGEQSHTPVVFTFSPMKESMEKQWRCSWAACSPAIPMPEMTDQAILLPEWTWCPETKQHETWQRSHPENPALHSHLAKKMPLIFMGAFALYFKKTGAVSLKLDTHPKKCLGSELLGRFFVWSHQSSLQYLSFPLWYHQHG